MLMRSRISLTANAACRCVRLSAYQLFVELGNRSSKGPAISQARRLLPGTPSDTPSSPTNVCFTDIGLSHPDI